jgi:hypothetical protein
VPVCTVSTASAEKPLRLALARAARGAFEVGGGGERGEVRRGLLPALLVEEAADIDRHRAEPEQDKRAAGEDDGRDALAVGEELPERADHDGLLVRVGAGSRQ